MFGHGRQSLANKYLRQFLMDFGLDMKFLTFPKAHLIAKFCNVNKMSPTFLAQGSGVNSKLPKNKTNVLFPNLKVNFNLGNLVSVSGGRLFVRGALVVFI